MANNLALWTALAVVWVIAFLFAILVVTRLTSIWSICVLDVALTVGVLATVAYLKSWTPDELDANQQLLEVFLLMGVLTLVVFFCVLVTQILGGIEL